VSLARILPVASCDRRAAPITDVSSSVTSHRSLQTAPPPSSSSPPDSPAADLGQDPAHLPQTRDAPTTSGPPFEARARALWTGIVEDDPDRAMAFFFPLGAYEQVKDVADPAADWRRRLVSAYTGDVHALHAWLGPDASRAKFVALEVPAQSVRWVDPGEEGNKIGYYRVIGSRLRYDLDGAQRTMNVRTLISWRGEWYVVHLRAVRR
jgi:hypothetical protein